MKITPARFRSRTQERGFSLIEGMLASVVLAMGLLTLAGMQSIALVRNVDANELTRVTTLGSDLIERMQFNRRNAVSYHSIDTQDSTTCSHIDASAQPMARGDCELWASALVSAGLDSIRGQVSVMPTGPAQLNQRQAIVTITWIGSKKSESSVRRGRAVALTRIIAAE